MQSLTEENYLKAIYKLIEQTQGTISTNAIAERMSTRAASVTDMLKKLAEKKLIHYEKYHGVTLTSKGEKIAVSVIRKHRLWEMFLVEKLSFGWDEVHDVAEQLEHIRSEKLINEIDKFLNFPKYDPHGDPIPDKNGKFSSSKSVSMNLLGKNNKCIITGVIDHNPVFLRFLEENGLRLGTSLQIKEVNAFDRSMLVLFQNKKQLFISEQVAKNLLVKK